MMTEQHISFDQVYRSDPEIFGRTITPMLRDLLAYVPGNGNVLDLGCGHGRDTLHLLRCGFNVTAVDSAAAGLRSLHMAASKEGLARRLRLVNADVFNVSAWSGSYDLINAVTLFDHLKKGQSQSIFSIAVSMLNAGGVVFCVVHSILDPGSRKDTSASPLSQFICHYFEPNELLSWAIDKQLVVVQYKDVIETDTDHGPVHQHGFAYLAARKADQ